MEEEIEVLDLSDNKDKVKKETLDKKKDNNKKEKKEKKKENKDKVKEKKKFKLWEKIFIIISFSFAFACCVFYGYRGIHYYNLIHNGPKDNKLVSRLTKAGTVVYQGDGLYEENGVYRYKGVEVNNYVYYSGRTWRIISIDKTIRMVTNDNQSILVWGYNSDYENSYINKWLNNTFYNGLRDKDNFVKKTSWCSNSVDALDYVCDETIDNNVGLVNIKEYLLAGGMNSYLNNHTFWWTGNFDKDNKAYYVNNEGSINNIVSNVDNYFSYGVRGVIELSLDTICYDGVGTMSSPYIIENYEISTIKEASVGNYVKMNDDMFRIMEINDNYVKLVYDGVLENTSNYNNLNKYLNDTYLKKFNKDYLVKIDYYINNYNNSNKYDYDKTDSKVNNYVGSLKMGDMFINEYSGYWLNNIYNNSKGINYIVDENIMLFGDLKTNSNKIRPVLALKSDTNVIEGIGIIDNPIIVGDTNEVID